MEPVNFEVEMEKRRCAGCGREFKVMTKSGQWICGMLCQKVTSGAPPSQLSKEKSEIESVVVSVGKTRPLELNTRKPSFLGEFGTRRELRNKKEQGQKEDTTSTEKKNSSENEIGSSEPGTRSMNTEETTTQKTESTSRELSTMAVVEEIQHTVSTVPSINLNEEILHSNNLLKNTGEHLHSLMKGMTRDAPSTEYQLLDQDRVKIAAELGKQIISTMRMRLDIMKFAKEVIEMKAGNDAN